MPDRGERADVEWLLVANVVAVSLAGPGRVAILLVASF